MSQAAFAPSALKAAGFVGTWETDVAANLSVLDEGAASLLSGDVRLAGQPLPLSIALGRIHPKDQDWVFQQIRRVRSTGGPISLEFRVLSNSGGVRWILNRGNLAPDHTGAMHGRGAYIDTTDRHRELFLPAEPKPLQDQGGTVSLVEAADHCIAARRAIDRTGSSMLRLLVDMLLLEIGRALASSHRRGRHDPV